MSVLSHLKRAEETLLSIGIGHIPACVQIEDASMIEDELDMREDLAQSLAEIQASRQAYYRYEEEQQESDADAAAWASRFEDIAFCDLPHRHIP